MIFVYFCIVFVLFYLSTYFHFFLSFFPVFTCKYILTLKKAKAESALSLIYSCTVNGLIPLSLYILLLLLFLLPACWLYSVLQRIGSCPQINGTAFVLSRPMSSNDSLLMQTLQLALTDSLLMQTLQLALTDSLLMQTLLLALTRIYGND